MSAAGFREVHLGGCLAAVHSLEPGGVHRLRSTEALAPYPLRLTDRLEEHAARTPDKTIVANPTLPAVPRRK